MLQTVSRSLCEWFPGALAEFLTAQSQLIDMMRLLTNRKQQPLKDTAGWQPRNIVTIGASHAIAISGRLLRFESRFACIQSRKVGFLGCFLMVKTAF